MELHSNYRFTLDIQKNKTQASIPVHYKDTGNRFYIALTDGGNPFIIPEGCRVDLYMKKPKGKPLLNACIIENNVLVRYDFNDDTANMEGLHNCELRIYSPAGRLITTPSFVMVVDQRVVYDDEIGTEEDFAALNALGIIASEQSRVNAENARVKAEAERVEAESARVLAENGRVKAEEGRVEAIKSAISEALADQAKEVENTIAKSLDSKENKVDADVVRERVSTLEDVTAEHSRELSVLDAASTGNLYTYKTETITGSFKTSSKMLPWAMMSEITMSPYHEVSLSRNKDSSPWFNIANGAVTSGSYTISATATVTLEGELLKWVSTGDTQMQLNGLSDIFQNDISAFTTKITLNSITSNLEFRFSYSSGSNDKYYILTTSGSNIYLGRYKKPMSVSLPTTLYIVTDLVKRKTRCIEESTGECLATMDLDLDYLPLFKSMCNPQIRSLGGGTVKLGDVSIFEGEVYPMGVVEKGNVVSIAGGSGYWENIAIIPDAIRRMEGYGCGVPGYSWWVGTTLHARSARITRLDIDSKTILSEAVEVIITGDEVIREEVDEVVFVDVLRDSYTSAEGICSDIKKILSDNTRSTDTTTEMILGKGDRCIYWSGILDKLGMTLEEFVAWLKSRYASKKPLVIHHAISGSTVDISKHLPKDFEYINLPRGAQVGLRNAANIDFVADTSSIRRNSKMKLTYREKV